MPETARPLNIRILKTIAAGELRRFSRDTRVLIWVPLAALSTVAALWPYTGTPFIPIWAAVLFGLDRQYSNIMFLSAHEVRAYAVFPPAWREIVLGKNLAAIILTVSLFVLLSIVTLYFLPAVPPVEELLQAVLYGVTVIFPLLALGNLRSVLSPRPPSRLTGSDMAEALITLILAGICSLPYGAGLILHAPFFSLAYACLTVWLWAWSLRKHVLPRVRVSQIRLCEVV